MKSLSANKLLVDETGKPLEFAVPLSTPSEIRSEIRENGGIVVSKLRADKSRQDDHNVIQLIHTKYKGDEYCVSIKFVIDSIKANQLQDITKYEFNPEKNPKLLTTISSEKSSDRSSNDSSRPRRMSATRKSIIEVSDNEDDDQVGSPFNSTMLVQKSNSNPSSPQKIASPLKSRYSILIQFSW